MCSPVSFADLDGHFWLGTAADWESQPTASNQQQAAPPNPGAAQNQSAQQQNQTNNIPSKFVIETSETENKGSYSVFHYQLEISKGTALTGSGYSVEEHISGASVPLKTSEHQFVPATKGEVSDIVGYARSDKNGQPHNVTLPKNFNIDVKVKQTFTVRYNGKNYNLTTRFEHETRVVKGTSTNAVTDVVP